jgi:hypothetical protein
MGSSDHHRVDPPGEIGCLEFAKRRDNPAGHVGGGWRLCGTLDRAIRDHDRVGVRATDVDADSSHGASS